MLPTDPSNGLNVIGNALANDITGNDAADLIDGGAGNDTLDGGIGADNLTGGLGDDTYVIDDAGDVVNEVADEGTDTIVATINIDLSASAMFVSIENVTLDGVDNLAAAGNDLANEITGNDGNNFLFGGMGNDTLNGGLGSDRLEGGEGDDTYVIDDAGDVVVEAADNGTDTVIASIDIDLSSSAMFANIENITLDGDEDLDATGNDLDNEIVGNSGDNILSVKSGMTFSMAAEAPIGLSVEKVATRMSA